MRRFSIVAAIALVAFANLGGVVKGADGTADAVASFSIADGELRGKNVFRVNQNQTVLLRWSADKATALHLHGYDIETTAKPDAPGSMRFKAHATGRFPVTVHSHGGGHGEKTLLYLEVYPN